MMWFWWIKKKKKYAILREKKKQHNVNVLNFKAYKINSKLGAHLLKKKNHFLAEQFKSFFHGSNQLS